MRHSSQPVRDNAIYAISDALLKDPNDVNAPAFVNTDKGFHSMLRTTCVATDGLYLSAVGIPTYGVPGLSLAAF